MTEEKVLNRQGDGDSAPPGFKEDFLAAVEETLGRCADPSSTIWCLNYNVKAILVGALDTERSRLEREIAKRREPEEAARIKEDFSPEFYEDLMKKLEEHLKDVEKVDLMVRRRPVCR